METLACLIVMLAVLWALAYHEVALIPGTITLVSGLAAWTVLSGSPLAVLPLWLLLALIAIPLNLVPFRRRWVSDPVMRGFRKILPDMSATEREALEAGSVWWEGELFRGRPDWQRLLDLPPGRLTPEEQAFIDGPVQELCDRLDDWHITQERADLPPEVWQFIKDKGFFGMIIPKTYGGLEFSALAHSSVVMKIATRSITAAVTVMVPNSLGPAELLLHYGTQAQKDYYLPRLARGEEVPCFALTGPEAGSDASAIPDQGVVCRGSFQGEEVLGIRLNWEKRYITLGPVATVLGLAFKLYDPDHLLGEQETLGITLALIPTDTPGITIGNRHAPLNMVFQNGPNSGVDVFIPMDWVIGGVDRVGQGWRMLMESLAAGRSISLPALSTGAAKLASRATGAYARIRKQFKLPIGKFEGVEEALARIAGNTYLMEAARVMTAMAVDLGEKPSVVSAIAKYHLTERMRRVVNDAMDVQGGSGICLGPRNLIGRVYQAIPISITVEGANILTRTLIIFGQGAIRCHPYVLAEMEAAKDPDEARGYRRFDRALFSHIGFSAGNLARAFFMGLTGARLTRVPGAPATRRYYRQLARMSAAFAFTADICMLMFGGALKRMEKLSGRLGDVLSHLYLASAVLKRFEDDGRPQEDLPLVRWACDECLFVIQQQMLAIFNNLPSRPLAWLLGHLIFPAGRSYHASNDRLGHSVAELLLRPSPCRDRLTKGIYLTDDLGQAVGRIEAALEAAVSCEPIEKKLQAAIRSGQLPKDDELSQVDAALSAGVIDAKEAERYRRMVALRREVIRVDDFDPGAFAKGVENGAEEIG